MLDNAAANSKRKKKKVSWTGEDWRRSEGKRRGESFLGNGGMIFTLKKKNLPK